MFTNPNKCDIKINILDLYNNKKLYILYLNLIWGHKKLKRHFFGFVNILSASMCAVCTMLCLSPCNRHAQESCTMKHLKIKRVKKYSD